MKSALKLASLIGLALVFLPVLVYLAGNMEKDFMKSLMLVGTALWFATAPFWMGREGS